MASTFSDLLKIELIGDGEQSGSWGTTTNNNLSQSLEHSIAGVLGVNTSSSTAITLTTGNGPQAQAAHCQLWLLASCWLEGRC